MEHKQKRQISAIMAAVLFALAVSMFIALSHSFITFTGVQNVRHADDMLYGVNINKTTNELFALNANTGDGQFIKIAQMGRNGVTSFPALDLADDGTVYLVRERFHGGKVTAMDLVRWDLVRNRIDTVVALPVTSEGNLTGFAAQNGQWYFLYYGKDASGEAAESAYTLTADGHYKKLASTDNDIDWDSGISGVAINTLPFKGVQQRTDVIIWHIVLLMLTVLAAEILLWLLITWWKSGPLKHRNLIRIAGCTIAAFVILITAFNVFMRTVVFNYVSNHKIYSCEVEAEVLARTIDQSLLDDLANGTDDHSPEVPHIFGNHWNLFTGIVVRRNNKLILEGDLFHRGSQELELNEGSMEELADEAFRTGEKISTIYAARRGANALVLQPVKTESGTETVICVRAPMREALYEAYTIRKHITRICYAILAGILLIAGMQIIWCLAPLEKLRRAIDELAGGNLKARATVRGRNELAYAAREFNLLADLLEEKQGKAEQYRHFYESFLPMNLLRKLVDDHFQASFKAGAQTETEAVILSLGIPDGVSGNQEGRKTLLSSLVQIVEENSGSVIEFRDDGFIAVFAGDLKNALFCSLKLQRKTQEESGKSAYMGVAAEEIKVFVAGCEQRREIYVKGNAEADILLELSKVLNNALIVSAGSDTVLHSEESGFHFRELGKMNFEQYSSTGELYALMDAELPDVRSKRERTQKDFENGVRAYASGDYFTARCQMIRCLLADPEDRTARSYCLNCERKEPPAICEAVR